MSHIAFPDCVSKRLEACKRVKTRRAVRKFTKKHRGVESALEALKIRSSPAPTLFRRYGPEPKIRFKSRAHGEDWPGVRNSPAFA